jgi:hypothetical protein
MTKVDELIKKFQEFKEELNKNGVNMSCTSMPNATTGTSGGEGGMYRSEVDKAEATKDAKVISTNKLIKPSQVEDQGASNFKIKSPKGTKISGGSRHPMTQDVPQLRQSEVDKCGEDMMAMSEDVIKFEKNGQWSLNKSAFKTLQGKIEREGHSKESAGAITASIGRKELGQKEMTARSKAGMNKVDPDENVNIAHPQGKAKMANGVNKGEDGIDNAREGTSQRIANPPVKDVGDARGKIHMVKDEGINEKAASSKPHNKGKFKVMDEVTEKESKKEKVTGLPYSGDDKKMHKADGTNHEATMNATAPKDPKGQVHVVQHKGTGPQGNNAKGNDENKAPGRGTLSV